MDGAEGIPTEWYFITAPQQVSWSKDSNVTPIDTYGTNNPYLQYGTTKLRALTLGNAMIEGFSDGKSIEGNVRDLEACMRMVIDDENGFASPFCWEVFAGNKSYGTYIITSVSVDESMRDNSGDAVRADVDVSLQEVSPYQVSTGEDISSEAISGGFNEETEKKMAEAKKDTAKSQDDAVKKSNDSQSDSSSSSSSDTGPTEKPTEIDTNTVLGNYNKN